MKKAKFRVATAGPTVDGRVIKPEWLHDIAETYNRDLMYGARVWMEHERGSTDTSAFNALGDVQSVELQTNNGRLELFATVEALPALVDMNKRGQKIYPSIEVRPNFAQTGKAYLTGLGVTDSPSSVGTQALKFSRNDKEGGALFFTANEEAKLQIEGEDEPSGDKTPVEDGKGDGFSAKFKSLLSKLTDSSKKTDAKHNALSGQVLEVMTAAQEAIEHGAKTQAELAEKFSTQGTELADLKKDFATLKTKLKGTENHSNQRPPATGKDASELADC